MESLDDLGEGEYIVMPEGVKVAPYKVTAEEARALAQKAAESYKDSDVYFHVDPAGSGWGEDFFEDGPRMSKRYENLIKTLKDKMPAFLEIIESKYRNEGPYTFTAGYLGIKHVDFEAGEPILDYRPLSVFLESNLLHVEDLYTGYRYYCRATLHPELNGYSSIQPSVSGDDENSIPFSISMIMNHGKPLRKIEKSEKVIIREPRRKPTRGPKGEIWYFPLWEVPMVSHREFLTERGTYFYLKRGILSNKCTSHEHKWRIHVPFITRGAVFFDGFSGKKISSVLADSFFNAENPQDNQFKCYAILLSDKKDLIKVGYAYLDSWLRKCSLTEKEIMSIPERIEFG